MAIFKPEVLKSIRAIEGGWVNDPDDSGQETFLGIARAKDPNPAVWAIVDDIKKRNPIFTKQAQDGNPKNLNSLLYANKELNDLIDNIYQRSYWDVNRLGEINDQQLAANVCDCGVNCGTKTSAIMLQKAYNLTTDKGKISEDGAIGGKTLGAINDSDAEVIYNKYNELRVAYYENIIARKPSQAKFRKSWMSRVKPYVN
ncbi:glycoside hydrolase family 108 protein [uncultured Clostridium sp.]|uniref:glycoside hydrolase family 108 protein n=1 Tax=uncultured Clostridium sp. TaxID=59620 RepID=UPI002601BE6C|nr:glycosyl hydrolase 108 family protein [uncultured Clostridium sp.]